MKKLKLKKTTRQNFLTYGLVIIAFAILQTMITSGSITSSLKGMLVPICAYVVMAISLNLTVGVLGELSLGHAGFMSVGAFTGVTAAVALQNLGGAHGGAAELAVIDHNAGCTEDGAQQAAGKGNGCHLETGVLFSFLFLLFHRLGLGLGSFLILPSAVLGCGIMISGIFPALLGSSGLLRGSLLCDLLGGSFRGSFFGTVDAFKFVHSDSPNVRDFPIGGFYVCIVMQKTEFVLKFL